MFRLNLLACLGLLPLAVSTLSAGVVFYSNDKPGWINAVGGSYLTEDFNDSTFNPGLGYTTARGQITGQAFHDWVAPGGEGVTHLLFGTPVVGAGADWDLTPSGPGVGVRFWIEYGDGSLDDLASPVPGNYTGQVPNTFNGQFFGFVSTRPFVGVYYSGGTVPWAGNPATGDTDYSEETLILDNLVYSDGSVPSGEVPEPATWALIGGALALLALRHR